MDHENARQRPDGARAGEIHSNLSRDKRPVYERSNGEALLMWDLLKDLAGFMGKRKKFWLAPLIVVMLLLGALIVLGQGSAIAPFIYT
ncbi:MAG TPA: DUF5989 family protein, partial [Spongiibacteraceae bacterium]